MFSHLYCVYETDIHMRNKSCALHKGWKKMHTHPFGHHSSKIGQHSSILATCIIPAILSRNPGSTLGACVIYFFLDTLINTTDYYRLLHLSLGVCII